MDTSPTIAVFEMLIQRLGKVEDGIARTEKLLKDQRAFEDVREIMLTPVTSLVGARLLPHEREYKLCERLEDILHDSIDISAPSKKIVKSCVDRLMDLGAHRLSFLMLCQISNMTEDLEPVLDLACSSELVPIEDAVAFMLHSEDLASLRNNDDPDRRDAILERISVFLDRYKSHWKTLGFSPGKPWIIGSY